VLEKLASLVKVFFGDKMASPDEAREYAREVEMALFERNNEERDGKVVPSARYK
jgi:hypothetical protein